MPDFSTVVVTAQQQVVSVRTSVPGSYDAVGRLGLGIFDVDEYRAGGTVTDTVALQSAVNAAKANGGGTVWVRAGRTLTITGMSVTSADNITIKGDGAQQSKIVMSGTTDAALLRFTICNRIRVDNLWLRGNNTSASDGPSGSAVYYDATGTSADLEGAEVEHCVIDNFKGGGWVRVQNGTAYDVTKVRFNKNVAFGGSDRAPATIGTASAMFACRLGTSSGNIRDIEMSGNICDAYTVKNALYCVQDGSGTGKFYRVRYRGNTVQRAGVSNSATVEGAYALIVYGGAVDVALTGNAIDGARQAGIYVNICDGLAVTGNAIRNVNRDQTHYPTLASWDNSLPRGGIAINDSTNISITGNPIADCDIGIQVSNGANSTAYLGTNVSIVGNPIRGGCIAIALRNGGGAIAKGYTLEANPCTGQTDAGIELRRVASTDAMDGVVVRGNPVIASASAISGYRGIGSSRDLYGARWDVDGNSVNCNGAPLSTAFALANATATGISSGKIRGNQAYNATTYGFSFVRTHADYSDNTADTCGTAGSAATGAFRTALAQGTWSNNRVVNPPASTFVIEASGSEDLGLDTPTWTGNAGTTVQTQSPTSGQQWGWVYTGAGAWKAFGTLA